MCKGLFGLGSILASYHVFRVEGTKAYSNRPHHLHGRSDWRLPSPPLSTVQYWVGTWSGLMMFPGTYSRETYEVPTQY